MDVALGHVIATTEAFDAWDGMIATLDYDEDAGRIRTLTRFGWPSSDSPGPMTAAQATSLGIRALHALGLNEPAAHPEVAWDDSMDAWLLLWPRVLDGVPMPKDCLRVRYGRLDRVPGAFSTAERTCALGCGRARGMTAVRDRPRPAVRSPG